MARDGLDRLLHPASLMLAAVAALGPAAAHAAEPVTFFVQTVATGLSQPINMVPARDGTHRMFVTEQSGLIKVYQTATASGSPAPVWQARGTFLDLTGRVLRGSERGLLGLAFHPQYAITGLFFVYYTDANGDNVLARYRALGDPLTSDAADPGSRTVLLTFVHPPATNNHNGGQIAFGPDEYLYVAVGDGGAGGGPAQDLGSLLGKLLRLDVDSGSPYGIPSSNPFVGLPGKRGEIWAYGLRNPWRFSFDRTTGDLFIGDVGQSAREEVDFQPAGAAGGRNYGWPLMEGTLCTSASPSCTNGTLTLPILEYPHGPEGDCSITGGLRVRGPRLPRWSAKYLYADYCTGRLFAGTEGAGGAWTSAVVLNLGTQISSFGEDEAGDVYVAGHVAGAIYRLVEAPFVSVSDATVTEGDSGQTLATFTATVSYDPPVTLSVGWSAVEGTATAGLDFALGTAGRIGFAPGDTAPRTITVPVFGDTLDEDDETFTVQLDTPMNAQIGRGVGVGTILDDDPSPTLTLSDAVVKEGDTGSAPAIFMAVLSAPSGRTVSVPYATVPGTAGPDDFVSTSGTLTIAPGSTSGSISVPVLGDTRDEPDEAFLVSLGAPVNAALSRLQAQGTILDDDGRASLCRPIYMVPFTITAQGRYCLVRNVTLAQPSGAAITIASDFVLLDLGGFKVGGAGAGPGTAAVGIYALDHRNITVRNGNVRGFLRGVFLEGGGSSQAHVVEAVRADGNTQVGIHVMGRGSVVRRNQVLSTGGTTAAGPDADTFGIRVDGADARILDNDVTDTVPVGSGSGYAIFVANGAASVIEKNRVGNSDVVWSAGIFAASGADVLVMGNRLARLTSGIVFDGATGKYGANLTTGVGTPYSGGTDAGGNQ